VAHAEAVLSYGGITWSISQEEVRRTDTPWRWSIRAEKDEPHWVVGSVKDLSSELRTEVRVSLPDVVSCCDYDLDGVYRLRKVEELGRDEDPYSEHVGSIPLPWICAFVEQAAQVESQSAARHAWSFLHVLSSIDSSL
jgi:hypothetical protein